MSSNASISPKFSSFLTKIFKIFPNGSLDCIGIFLIFSFINLGSLFLLVTLSKCFSILALQRTNYLTDSMNSSFSLCFFKFFGGGIVSFCLGFYFDMFFLDIGVHWWVIYLKSFK